MKQDLNQKGQIIKRRSKANSRRGSQIITAPSSTPMISRRIVVIEETFHAHGMVFDGRNFVANPGLVANPWGIDVSHHNGSIDWAKVREAGCEFAFMKATEGATFVDRTFSSHFAAAKANGVLRGAYHFFQPKSSTVAAQVENFCRVLGSPQRGDLQPVLDIENDKLYSGLTPKQCADLAMAWIDGVRARLGDRVRPIIYCSPSFVDRTLGNDSRLSAYPLWIANYTSGPAPRVPRPWMTWDLWQYTESGSCPGINGNVDINRCNGDRGRLEMLTIN